MHNRIAPRKDQSLSLVVRPPNQEGWLSTLSFHFEDLTLFVGLADVVTLDHEMVAGLGMHRDSLRIHPQHPPPRYGLIGAKGPMAAEKLKTTETTSQPLWVTRYSTAPSMVRNRETSRCGISTP